MLFPPSLKFMVLCYVVGLGWAVLQLLPLWSVHPVWQMTAQALGQPVYHGISLNPGQGVHQIMLMLAYGVAFYLAFCLGRKCTHLYRLLTLFVVIQVGYACYGLMMEGTDKILWYHKWAYHDSLTSTFVGRNAYAAYNGLGILVASVLLFHHVLKGTQELKRQELSRKILKNISKMGYLYLLAITVLGAALLLTHSRAGAASVGIGWLVLVLLMTCTRDIHRHRRWFVGILVSLTVVISLLFIAGGAYTIKRYASLEESMDERAAIYHLTWQAIKNRPWTGYGLGSFEGVFRMYRDQTMSHKITSRIDHAHNTYLELALELGIPATLILLLIPFVLIVVCIRGIIRQQSNGMVVAIGVAATIQLGLHVLVDFSIEMPAVAFAYVIIMGLAYRQSLPEEKAHA